MDQRLSGIRERAQKLAGTFDVSADLHEGDHMLRHLASSAPHGIDFYFSGGDQDARQICRLIERLGLPASASVLEFAAGYGRMTRHLTRLLSPRRFVASDIHPEAVSFLSELGCPAFPSTERPESLACDERFDLVFAISLFSHLPDELFARWLRSLRCLLKPGGHLMFTTHGQIAADKEPSLKSILHPRVGYGFQPDSEQKDLDGGIYGTMVVMPHYVAHQTDEAGLRVKSFSAGEWWHFQDEWVVTEA